MDLLKKCSLCTIEFPATLEYFSSSKGGKFGFRGRCRTCEKIVNSDPDKMEKARKRRKRYREKNPEKIKELRKNHYDLNNDLYNQIKKERLKNDPEFARKHLESQKKYRESGKKKLIDSKPENKYKRKLKHINRMSVPEKREMDNHRSNEWNRNNRDHLLEISRNSRKNIDDSYVVSLMRKKAGELTPEIIETRRLIIQIKRELKNR